MLEIQALEKLAVVLPWVGGNLGDRVKHYPKIKN